MLNLKRVVARPFSGSPLKNRETFGRGFVLDVEAATAWLEEQDDSFEKKLLLYLLKTRGNLS